MKRYPTQSNLYSNLLYKYLKDYRIFLVYIPLILYWITLFILTTIPADSMPQLFDNQDKIEHLLAYFGLALLLSLTLNFQEKFRYLSSKAFLFTFIFILAYAAVDELHQMLIPGRYCDFYDWLADSIGGSLGIIIICLFIRNRSLQNPVETEA